MVSVNFQQMRNGFEAAANAIGNSPIFRTGLENVVHAGPALRGAANDAFSYAGHALPNLADAKASFLQSLAAKSNEGMNKVFAELAERAMANPEVAQYYQALAQQSGFQGATADQFAKHMIGQQVFAHQYGGQAASQMLQGGYAPVANMARGGNNIGFNINGNFNDLPGLISKQLAANGGNQYAATDNAIAQILNNAGVNSGDDVAAALAKLANTNAASGGGSALSKAGLTDKQQKLLDKLVAQHKHNDAINYYGPDAKVKVPGADGKLVDKLRHKADKEYLEGLENLLVSRGYEKGSKKFKKAYKQAASKIEQRMYAYDKAQLDVTHNRAPKGKNTLEKFLKELGLV